jgi:hypothetical protein
VQRSDAGRKKHNQAKRRARKARKREQKIKGEYVLHKSHLKGSHPFVAHESCCPPFPYPLLQSARMYSKISHPELAPEVGHKKANRAGVSHTALSLQKDGVLCLCSCIVIISVLRCGCVLRQEVVTRWTSDFKAILEILQYVVRHKVRPEGHTTT